MRLWIGRVLSTLAVLFTFVDGIMKLVKPAVVLEANVRLGYPESTLFGIGLLLILCTIIYAIPRTSIFGAILLTGYLGGAVATHVRAGSSVFETVFPVLLGIVLWAGLWLRDKRLQILISTFDSPPAGAASQRADFAVNR